MEKNKKILLVIIIIVIAVIGSVIFIFSSNSVNKSPFSNDFMKGEFVGTVNVMNNSDKWAVAYKDPVHHIEYNMSTCKNASFLIDLYKLQGMKGPEIRNYNGNEWNIYTGQGVSQVGNTTSNDALYVYMCVANKDNQSYVIYAIFTNSTELNVDGSLYCDGFKQYIEPLLSSIELKHNSNVPSLAELLGMDESSFDSQALLFSEAAKGNQTAIQMLSGE